MNAWKTIGYIVTIGLLFNIPTFAAKGGNGKGNGNGGGGGSDGGGDSDTCSVTVSRQPVDTLVDTSVSNAEPIVEGLNGIQLDFDGYRIGSRAMDAVVRPSGDILLAASSSTTPNVNTSINRVIILAYSPTGGWTFLNEVLLDPVDGSYSLGTNGVMRLFNWDGNSYYEIVIGSTATNQALIIWDVDDPATPVQVSSLPVPADAEFFGRSVGFGDVDSNGDIEVLVGDIRADAIYVYHDPFPSSSPDKLSGPAGENYGQQIELGIEGLYVGAYLANASKRERDAGGVYHYPRDSSGRALICDGGGGVCLGTTDPILLTRAIKNENLGRRLALTSLNAVVATPTNGSIAVFPSGSTTSWDLSVPDFGFMDNVSVGNLNGTAVDEIVSGRSNAGSDSGGCYNVGAATLSVDNDATNPIILRSHDVIDQNGLFFGRSTAIAGGYLFIGEMGRDINGNISEDGQIYVFSLNN